MKIVLVDNGSVLIEKLENLIPGAEIFRRWQDIKPEDAQADCVILSGSSKLCIKYNREELGKEIDLIKSAQGVVVGICLGAEIIADIFGGELVELSQKEKGIKEITIVSEDPIFEGKKMLQVYEGHRWAIKSLPEDFEVLARSNDGIEIFKHTTRPLYGFQFHPENMVADTGGDEVFLNLFRTIAQ